MAAHGTTLETHEVGSTRLFVWVWVWLAAITGVEVFVAYLRLPTHIMLTLLVGLSIIKSALIVAYFMHMRFERLGLFLTIVPVLVFCLVMIMIFFLPDSERLIQLRHLIP